MTLSPSAIEENITALCEIDLSEGIVIEPFNEFLRETFFNMLPHHEIEDFGTLSKKKVKRMLFSN